MDKTAALVTENNLDEFVMTHLLYSSRPWWKFSVSYGTSTAIRLLVVQHFDVFCPRYVMLCGLQIGARRQALALPFFLPEIELPFPISSFSSSSPEHFRFRLCCCCCWCWRQSAPGQSIQGGNYPNQPQPEVTKKLKFCVSFRKFTAMTKFIIHFARSVK